LSMAIKEALADDCFPADEHTSWTNVGKTNDGSAKRENLATWAHW
jgi:hypothetical protein